MAHHELVGWRTWRLFNSRSDGAVLFSASRDDAWLSPVHRTLQPPRSKGSDGIYSLYSEEAVGAYSVYRSDLIVYGQVTLGGRVCRHEYGMRAELARIDCLYLKPCGVHPILPTANDENACDARSRVPWLADLSVDSVYCRCSNRLANSSDTESARRDLSDRYQCDVTVVHARPSRGTCETWRRYERINRDPARTSTTNDKRGVPC